MVRNCTTQELRILTRQIGPLPAEMPITTSMAVPILSHRLIFESEASDLEKEKALVLCGMLQRRRKRLGRINGRKKLTAEQAKVKGVPMSSEILREVLSRNDTVHFLTELGIIEMKENYSAGFHSRSYWFTEQVLEGGYTKVRITNKRLVEKLSLWRSSQLFHRLNSGSIQGTQSITFIRLLEDMSQIRLTKEGSELLDEAIAQLEPNAYSVKKIKKYLKTGYDLILQISGTGRITSHISCLPHREMSLRHHLILNGEHMIEWDIPSSHIGIILSLFNDDEKESIDYQVIPRLINFGHFYDAYSSTWELDKDETACAKILFQKIINSPRQDWRTNRMFQQVSRELPVFADVLEKLKRKYPGKRLSNHIQSLEAQLLLNVVTRLHETGIPCYTVYDSIGVKLSHADQARNIFDRELRAYLGIPLRVKTDNPVWEDPESTSVIHSNYRKEILMGA